MINVGNLCTYCNYPLSSEEHFFKHFDKHVLQTFANTSLLSPQMQNPDKKHVECIVCKQPLTSAAELQTHAKFHSHIDVTARGYRCSVCYQTFQTKTNLHCKVLSAHVLVAVVVIIQLFKSPNFFFIPHKTAPLEPLSNSSY